jgi:hypothetical protein
VPLFNIYNTMMITTYLRVLLFIFISNSLFAQNNQTGNFAPMNAKEPQNEFGATIVSPAFPNIILVATAGKIIKSMDNGDNWTTIYTKNGLWVNQFVMPTPNPDIILAATNQGLMRSINGGLDWVAVLPDQSKTNDLDKYESIDKSNIFGNNTKNLNQTPATPKKQTITNIPNPNATFVGENEVPSNIIPQVSLSPNPVSSDGKIKVETNLTGEMKFVLYNDKAQLLKTIKFSNSIEIDLSGTLEGKYFYRVENKSFKMGGVLLVQ